MDTKNSQTNNTTSYKGSLKVLCFLHADSYLLPTDLYFLHADSYLLPADSYLLPADSYLLHAEFKSDHTSNSVRVLSSFHQVRHQQEYSHHNQYICATLEYSDP